MSIEQELHDRLETLKVRIDEAQEKERLRHVMHNGDCPSASDLSKRYHAIQDMVAEQTEDREAHGEHLSSLEKSVMEWFDSFAFDR